MKRLLTILIFTISVLTNGILFYLYWTNRIDTTPLFDPFEINYNVTENSLVKAGYTPIPEDVPLLGKQVGDTLIYYQLDYECGDAIDIEDIECENTGVYWRNCVIYLDKLDSELMISQIQKGVFTTLYKKDLGQTTITDVKWISNSDCLLTSGFVDIGTSEVKDKKWYRMTIE